MSQEYEFVRYSRLHHIKVFLNEIKYRNYHTHNAFELLFVLDGEGRLSLQTGSIAKKRFDCTYKSLRAARNTGC